MVERIDPVPLLSRPETDLARRAKELEAKLAATQAVLRECLLFIKGEKAASAQKIISLCEGVLDQKEINWIVLLGALEDLELETLEKGE